MKQWQIRWQAKKWSFVISVLITVTALIAGCATPATHPADAPAFQSGYAPVNGLSM